QREWLSGEVLERQLGYWKRQLANLSVLRLSTAETAVSRARGDHQSLALSKSLSKDLNLLCRQEGVTLFMLLLAAFQALLHRYSGQEDISVGSPIANRNRAEVEGLIGFFVNMLVLRTDLGGDPSFRELLGRVRNVALNAYAHQDFPFEQLVETLQPERDLNHTPLFQVAFVLQNAPRETLKLTGVTLSAIGSESTSAKFDLTLAMTEASGDVSCTLQYRTDLFEAETISRLLDHYQNLLTAIVADPDPRLSRLSLLREAERRQLIYEYNATARDYPTQSTVHQMFRQQAERTPEAVAVFSLQDQLNFAELDARSNRLAHYLGKFGVRPEVRVGLLIDRSIEMVIALLGVLKAGGAYVPLDPAYPAERLEFMLRDADVPVLLSTEALATTLPATGARVISLDGGWAEIAAESTQEPAALAGPDNLAYVIYTSGSTGTPKGVMITHRNLVNYLSWSLATYPVTEGSGAPVHTSISFDLTVTSLWLPLLAGRPIRLLSEDIGAESLRESLSQAPDYSLLKLTPNHVAILSQE